MPFTGSAWGPNYSSDQSYGVQNTNTGRAGGVPNTGASFDWQGATATIAGSLISGFFESRNQSAQIASNARQQESSARYASYMQDVDRHNQQQDRRWLEQGMAAYRSMYGGSASGPAPVLTDPGTRPVDPYTRPRG